jgi:hypothetical protein
MFFHITMKGLVSINVHYGAAPSKPSLARCHMRYFILMYLLEFID